MLLMTENLHDLVYQNPKKYGGIVAVGHAGFIP